MNKLKIATIIALTSVLSACANTGTPHYFDLTQLEGANIAEMRDLMGEPSRSETLEEGTQLDVFVNQYDVRVRRRGRDARDDFPITRVAHRTEFCEVGAEYDAYGQIQSVVALDDKCLELSRNKNTQ